MKLNKYLIFLIFLLLASTLFASFVEQYNVKVQVLQVLSENETNAILKKYNTVADYSIGVKVKVLYFSVGSESHTDKRFTKGQVLRIVVTSDKDNLKQSLAVGKKALLEYNYYDDYDPSQGAISTISWIIKEE